MLSLIKELAALEGVSGEEYSIFPSIKQKLEKMGKVEMSPLGSVICVFPCIEENLPVVMLEAHLDRIGFSVSEITKEGFLKVNPCGGIDIRATLGAKVTVCTQSKKIDGIICSLPSHIEEKKLPIKADKLYIDVHMNEEEALKNISIGDKIFIKGNFIPLLNNNVSASALDDRAGCAAVIKAGELLANFKKAKVVLCLSSQEEVGGSGAKTAANIIKPDYAIAVDVSFADTPLEPHECCTDLGKGPIIGFSPILSRDICNLMIAVAKKHEIPYQVETMGGRTGTDADSILIAHDGVKMGLISIPQRYMHTPCEVINIQDIENTALLMAKVVEELTC